MVAQFGRRSHRFYETFHGSVALAGALTEGRDIYAGRMPSATSPELQAATVNFPDFR